MNSCPKWTLRLLTSKCTCQIVEACRAASEGMPNVQYSAMNLHKQESQTIIILYSHLLLLYLVNIWTIIKPN